MRGRGWLANLKATGGGSLEFRLPHIREVPTIQTGNSSRLPASRRDLRPSSASLDGPRPVKELDLQKPDATSVPAAFTDLPCGTQIALLYPGDRATRDRSDPTEGRFGALFAAFAAAGMAVCPAVYNDEFADEVESQLRGVQLVLVWCNPIEGGRRRTRLDELLRRVADSGVLVSAHPDAILALGTKDVLVETRDLPFGSDVHRVDSLAQLEAELPQRLRRGARVLKQHRGHSGIGVWRVEREAGASQLLRVRHAQRASEEERMEFAALLRQMAPFFEVENGGHMIDQAWQPDNGS